MQEKTQKYIVRCDKAGVFYADVTDRRGDEADLKNARRIYYWNGAATLSELSQSGCKPDSKITVPVPTMTVLGVIEVIPCSKKCQEVIDGIKEWKS